MNEFRKRDQYLNIFFIAALALATYLFGTTVLYRNWDVLPYMATILKVEGGYTVEEIHQKVFEEAEKHIPAKQYKKLTNEESAYRKTIHEHPEELEEQLPFYYVKPLYVLAAYASYKLGFHLPYATTFPSAVAYVLICLLLFHWLSSCLSKPYALLLCLLFIFIPPLNKLSRYASPDGLSNLFLLVSMYLFLAKEVSLWKVNALLALAILTRSDNVIYALALNALIYIDAWLKRKPQHGIFWGSAVLLVACYLLPQLLIKPPGWSVLFYHTFIEPSGTPISAPSSLTPDDYWKVMAEYAPKAFSNVFLYLMLAGTLLFIPKLIESLWQKVNKAQLVVLAMLGTACVKFVLFPVFWDRMYLTFNIVLTVLLIQWGIQRWGKTPVDH